MVYPTKIYVPPPKCVINIITVRTWHLSELTLKIVKYRINAIDAKKTAQVNGYVTAVFSSV